MKKVLAVLTTLVLAVTLCVPSFAADPSDSGVLDQIIATVGPVIEQIIGSITGGGTPTLPSVPSTDELASIIAGMLQGATLDAATAETIVDAALKLGVSKADVEAAIQQLEADGVLNADSVAALKAALDAAEEPTTSAPIVSDEQAQEIAAEIISALKGLGITADQMRDVVDALYERNIIPRNVYDLVQAQINASEETTAAEEEGGLGGLLGGVGDFFGGIFDTIGGMLGFGGDNGDGGDGGDVDKDANDFGGEDATGDTAAFTVVGVAAAAGAVLLLTRKKKSDK